MYRYGDTTWGVTVDERIVVAAHELGWSPKDLSGKTILDAGCGNGTLSAGLAAEGAEVVGIDLSESVLRAHQHVGGPCMHFAQGNLFFPPLRKETFDAIYSCGVFHHTPDTRRCFDALVPALKRNPDARYFVWLYARRSALFNATVEQLMKVTRRLPGRVLAPLCFATAPVVEPAARVLSWLGLHKDIPRSLADRAVILHDLLSPRYVRYHTADQCRTWAIEAGLKRTRQVLYRVEEDGQPDRKAVLEKYWRVCRPGFGILARYP
jgi:SAM-dependent methyltransferase